MANDRALGGGILGGSVVGIIIHGALMYYWPLLLLEITALAAVVVLLGILAWIGWTMASTPPPEIVPEVPPAAAVTATEDKTPPSS